MLETVLAPYRGERIVQQIPVKIPTSASKGTLRILVSDGETLDHIGRSNPLSDANSIWHLLFRCLTRSTRTTASMSHCWKPTLKPASPTK